MILPSVLCIALWYFDMGRGPFFRKGGGFFRNVCRAFFQGDPDYAK